MYLKFFLEPEWVTLGQNKFPGTRDIQVKTGWQHGRGARKKMKSSNQGWTGYAQRTIQWFDFNMPITVTKMMMKMLMMPNNDDDHLVAFVELYPAWL